MGTNVHTNRPNHQSKVRLTIFCAKNLAKHDFFSHPDPYCKIEVIDSRQDKKQEFLTDIYKDTLNPLWNVFFDLNLNSNCSISISVFNNKKEAKKPSSGFLGCVKIMPNMIQTLKNTGFQNLNLHKSQKNSNEYVRGQIVISLLSISKNGTSRPIENNCNNEPIDTNNENTNTNNGLPDGWEQSRTPEGLIYYIDHNTR